MKYFIIPIFRIITLPILIVFFIWCVFCMFIRDLWNWEFYHMKEFYEAIKNKEFNGFPQEINEYYAYNSFKDYIINKKSQIVYEYSEYPIITYPYSPEVLEFIENPKRNLLK